MKILRGAEAPVEAVHFYRRFGFIRPSNDTELYELIHGHDIFFHFDKFEMVHAFRGRVTYRFPSMDENILWLTRLTPGLVLHFDLHVQQSGKYKASPWTIKSLWDDAVRKFERRQIKSAHNEMLVCQ